MSLDVMEIPTTPYYLVLLEVERNTISWTNMRWRMLILLINSLPKIKYLLAVI